ncbi:lipopolysaccharide exporter periplasmic protein [Kingella potus]|uniref:Lipopolysaccharide exporter periplasmic protein n=1 Tax=Kingella potus TaxID=265175 RepID=A0A377R1N7_9NEIS|nr:LPS export ABC transporter periplasmic protein LptC [Kingella potus]UOP00757.1 LPS export ABC transporter periplasmic protein LptC [Kingella potus]STR02838.1 lipopolysaccharide exporter periplasmic protein [Kingella potus]
MTGKRYAGWLFPLVLALGLGGLSAWLDRISTVTVEETALNPNEPQYAMEGISGSRFDKQGALQDRLDAQSARQFPDSKEVVFRRPLLQVYAEGKKAYQVGSEEARYDTGSRQILFEKQVVLNKEAADGKPAGRMAADNLTVDTVSKTAAAAGPVRFDYGASQGTADGMTYDYNRGLLRLPSRVKATLYDPQNP